MNNFWKWNVESYGIQGVLASKDIDVYELYDIIKERGDDFISEFEDAEDFAASMENLGVCSEFDVYREFEKNEFVLIDWDDWYGCDYDE